MQSILAKRGKAFYNGMGVFCFLQGKFKGLRLIIKEKPSNYNVLSFWVKSRFVPWIHL